MTVAHDTTTRWPAAGADNNTGDQTFTHTPISGSPAGVVVIVQSATFGAITGVLYNGVNMNLTTWGYDTTETGRTWCFTLSPIPSGAQTVTIQGATAADKYANCCTVTAATPSVQVAAATGITPEIVSTDPQVDVTLGMPGLTYGGIHSGLATFASLTVIAGCTQQNFLEYGTKTAACCRRTTQSAAGIVTIGYTAASDDWAGAAVAFGETTHPRLNTRRPAMAQARQSPGRFS